jgi:hypothetical protein
LWLGTKDARGYGSIRTYDEENCRWKMEYAHRVAWGLAIGDIPDGLCVLHHCDTPACCNPAHLWLGTVGDNSADMVEKGRQAKGMALAKAHGNAKLTEDEVLSILKDSRSELVLGRIYGVHHSTIWLIRRGENWAWLRSRGEAVGT